MFSDVKYLVAGAGFAGAVIAERIASVLKERVIVIDRRKHIGGTSYSEIDPETGIECHLFGSHIFHTARADVWNYIRRFADFNHYRHKVMTTWRNRVYTMPVNLKTINDFYGLNLKPHEVEKFIEAERRQSYLPENLRIWRQCMDMLSGTGNIPGGRLGRYKYWNKDKTIDGSLEVFEQLTKGKLK